MFPTYAEAEAVFRRLFDRFARIGVRLSIEDAHGGEQPNCATQGFFEC